MCRVKAIGKIPFITVTLILLATGAVMFDTHCNSLPIRSGCNILYHIIKLPYQTVLSMMECNIIWRNKEPMQNSPLL